MDRYGENAKLREEVAKLAGAVIIEMEKIDSLLKDVMHTLTSRNVVSVTLTRHAPVQIAALMHDLGALKDQLEKLSVPAKHGE